MEFLREIDYFFDQSILRIENPIVSLRLLYINIAFFLICIDFLMKNYILLDKKSRMELLADGFHYGERGKERTEGITNAAIKLASSIIANQSIARTLQNEVEKQNRRRPVEILADFFSKNYNMNSLFEAAKLFESISYSHNLLSPSNLPAELQSFIGLLADFFRKERRRILDI